MKKRSYGAVALIGMMAACGSSDGKGAGASSKVGSVVGAELSSRLASFIEAGCNKEIECFPDLHPYTDLNGCYLAVGTALGCSDVFAPFVESIPDACIEALRSATCEELLSNAPLEGCDFGTAQRGDRCGGVEDGFCGVELTCIFDESDCGTCQERAAIGGDCSFDDDCLAGAYCNDDDHCRELKEAGASCEISWQCLSDTCVDGRCVEPQLGDRCESESDCGALTCFEGKCARARAIGESCGDEASCVQDAFCVEGKCKKISRCGEAVAGAACLAFRPGQCESGLICKTSGDGDAAHCAEPQAEGGSCEWEGDCVEGLGCSYASSDGDEGVCTELPGEGESCQGVWSCKDDLTCDVGGGSSGGREAICMRPPECSVAKANKARAARDARQRRRKSVFHKVGVPL